MAYKKFETRSNANIKTKNDVFKTIRILQFYVQKALFYLQF